MKKMILLAIALLIIIGLISFFVWDLYFKSNLVITHPRFFVQPEENEVFVIHHDAGPDWDDVALRGGPSGATEASPALVLHTSINPNRFNLMPFVPVPCQSRMALS
jgi:hypothetical protein